MRYLKDWFWVALIFIVIAGYQLGKYRALTANEKDKAHEIK